MAKNVTKATNHGQPRAAEAERFKFPLADGFARPPKPLPPLRASACPDCGPMVAIQQQCFFDRSHVRCVHRRFTSRDLFIAIAGRDPEMLREITVRVPQSRFRRMLASRKLQKALDMELDAQTQISSHALGASLGTLLRRYEELAFRGSEEHQRKVLLDLIGMARTELASRLPAPAAIRRREAYRLVCGLLESGHLPRRKLAELLFAQEAPVGRPRRLPPSSAPRKRLPAAPAKRIAPQKLAGQRRGK